MRDVIIKNLRVRGMLQLLLPQALAARGSKPKVNASICAWTPSHYAIDFCSAFEEALRSGLMHNDSLVVDVGAAYGWEAQIARHYGFPVLSFDCRTDEVARLRNRFSSDGFHQIEHGCLSNGTMTAVLHRAWHSSSLEASMVDERTHSREHRLQRREMNKTETVQTFALDEFWSSHTFKGASLWPPVAFLKVDTRKRLESMEPAYAANPLMPLPPPTLLLLLPPPRQLLPLLLLIACLSYLLRSEGHDEAVLRGAEATIRRDHPFILYEDEFIAKEQRGGVLLHTMLHETSAGNRTYECLPWERNTFCMPMIQKKWPGRSLTKVDTSEVDTPASIGWVPHRRGLPRHAPRQAPS
jgi:hypothetical protein